MAFISAAEEIIKKSYTLVENKFINKYLPDLEPAAVKTYIFALYVLQNGQTGYDSVADFAKKLNLSEEEVINYFEYLEEFELIAITSRSPLEIKILDCGNVYGSPKKIKPEKYAGFSTEVQAIVSGRMISPNEFLEYYYLLEEYGFERNALLMIISYCVNLKGNDIRSQYIKKVAKTFADEGVVTVKKVEERLSSYTSSTPALIKIFTACSISRRPDVDDDKLYTKWSKELGFSDDAIIAAAKYFKARNTEKIDLALTELYKNKKFDVKEIDDYCKTKNSVFAATLEIAKSLGVYMQNAAPYVENYVSVWCNYGFELSTLKRLATFCFMHGKNSFEVMHDFVLSLYDEGVITDESVQEKLAHLDAEDKLIKNILNKCGLTRKVIASDRDCLKRWKDWNFSDEMVLKAAESAFGKNNPVAYMNAVLSSWKNDGIFSPDKITQTESGTASAPADNKKAIIERHYYDLRNAAEQRADKALKTAMADDVYGSIKKQLDALSIKLAFAELDDKAKAEKISEQISDLEEAGDKRLKELNLDKSSFVPAYSCKICNDTGYDKSGKQCECLKKFIKVNNL